jgi:hypothetical protein
MEPRCRGRRTKITSSSIVDCINQDVLESTLTEQGLQEQVVSATYEEQFLQRSLAFEEVKK